MRSGLLLIAAMVAGSNSPARGAVPDWVEALKSIPTPAYEPGVQGVCLLNEAVIQVTAAGEIKETRRTAYKILGRQGLSLAWVQLSYDGDTKASGIKGWNVKADGVVHEVGSRDAIESHFAGGGGILFDDVKKLLLPVPQAEIGSLIAFEYEKKHRPLILQDAFQIQGLYPVLVARYDLELPDEWSFAARIVNHASGEPKQVSKKRWVWQFTRVPAVPIEEGMPPPGKLAAVLWLSFVPASGREVRGHAFESWDRLAAWFHDLSKPRAVGSSELTDLARRISDPTRVAEFVQKEIRYVAMELGIGGFQPHASASILRSKYGDCKDKVTIFRTLMEPLGWEVNYVLIHADGRIPIPDFPSPYFFNHAIAAIRVSAQSSMAKLDAVVDHPELGKLLLFDPTDPHTPFGSLPQSLESATALLVREDRGYLLALPSSTENHLYRSGTFELSPVGGLSGRLTDSYEGILAVAARAQLQGGTHGMWLRDAHETMADPLPGVFVKKLAVSGLNQSSALSKTYELEVQDFAQAAGDTLMLRPALFGPPALPALPVDEERKHPFRFPFLGIHSENLHVRLPAGYVVEVMPEMREMNTPFANYRMEAWHRDGTIEFAQSLKVSQLELTAEQVPKLRELARFVRQCSRSVVILKKKI